MWLLKAYVHYLEGQGNMCKMTWNPESLVLFLLNSEKQTKHFLFSHHGEEREYYKELYCNETVYA